MRTKTLLLSAAALVAGLATSQAQVYSQNVVGYATLTLSPNNLALVAPTLDVDGTGTNGTITTVLGTNCAENTQVFVFNGTGYDILAYAPTVKFGTPVWNINNIPDPTYPLNVGVGFWILDPTDTSVTLSGNVLQGSLVNKFIPSGASTIGLISDQVPLSGGITTVLGYTPTENDQVFIYNGSGYNIYAYAPTVKFGTPVWNLNNVPSEPQISVGQGFWLVPGQGGETWNQTFNVQ